jgi:hypothetical protein
MFTLGGFYMQDLSLEKEFEIYKEIHKVTILQAKMTMYYETKQGEIKLPSFMTKPPSKQAEEDVLDLMCKNPDAFNSLYERAWSEYAESLP